MFTVAAKTLFSLANMENWDLKIFENSVPNPVMLSFLVSPSAVGRAVGPFGSELRVNEVSWGCHGLSFLL